MFNVLVGIVLPVALIGITLTMICLFDTKLGLYISLTSAFFIFYISRMIGDILPLGIIVDMLSGVTFLGMYFRRSSSHGSFWHISRGVITTIYLINLGYLLVEAFNPSMHNIAGWAMAFRKFLVSLMLFFICLHVFKTFKDIREFFYVWIGLCIFTGFYGCFQEWFGLLRFEDHWVTSDPKKYALYFQGGTIRKFSFLSDPTSFGMRMANTIIIAVVLILGPTSRRYKKILIAGSILMALGMAYSGTRTAYFMLPSGIILYILMTIGSKKTLLFAVTFLMMFVALVFGPYHSNGTINRIRTTFEFTDDESFNIRDVNRHRIQPYIWSHPIGGGLMTCGVPGLEYNPGHVLAGFPPDSGLLKNALEGGWIFLILISFTYFLVLQQGIHGYYRSNVPEFRMYYVAITASLFALLVGNYAQDAVGQIPGVFLYFGCLAVIVRLRTMELEMKKQHNYNLSNIK